jgi:hypothetical protein
VSGFDDYPTTATRTVSISVNSSVTSVSILVDWISCARISRITLGLPGYIGRSPSHMCTIHSLSDRCPSLSVTLGFPIELRLKRFVDSLTESWRSVSPEQRIKFEEQSIIVSHCCSRTTLVIVRSNFRQTPSTSMVSQRHVEDCALMEGVMWRQ